MKVDGELYTTRALPGTQGVEDVTHIHLPPNPSCLGVNPSIKGKIRPVKVWPDPILTTICDDVTLFSTQSKHNDSLGQLIMDLAATVVSNKGLGLAANQIGDTRRVILIETGNGVVVLINPVITNQIGRYKLEEGCLSVPGYYEDRTRNRSVDISYVNTYNKERTRNFQGVVAFAVQHEIDHLNGITFVDELSKLKKDRIKKKITKTRR